MRRQLVTSVLMIILLTIVCGLGFSLAMTGIGEVAFGHQANGSIIKENGSAVGSSLIGQSFTDKSGDPISTYFQSRPSDAVTSSDTDNITVGAASNYGPSNPLLIGFVPGVNTVDLKGDKSATNPFATPTDPFCVPMSTGSSSAPVVAPTIGQKYEKNGDGTYACDPDTVPHRAMAYRTEFGLAPNAEVPTDAVTASASGLDPDISIANADIQASTVARARGLSLAQVKNLIAANTTGRSLGLFGDPGVNVLTLNIALDNLSQK